MAKHTMYLNYTNGEGYEEGASFIKDGNLLIKTYEDEDGPDSVYFDLEKMFIDDCSDDVFDFSNCYGLEKIYTLIMALFKANRDKRTIISKLEEKLYSNDEKTKFFALKEKQKRLIETLKTFIKEEGANE